MPPAGKPSRPAVLSVTTDYMLAGLVAAAEVSFGPVTLYPALRFGAYRLTPEKRIAAAHLRRFGAGWLTRVSPKVGASDQAVRRRAAVRQLRAGLQAPEPSQVNNFYFANPPIGYTSIANPNLKPENGRLRGAACAIQHAGLVRPDRLLCPLSRLHRPGGNHRPALPVAGQSLNLPVAQPGRRQSAARIRRGPRVQPARG